MRVFLAIFLLLFVQFSFAQVRTIYTFKAEAGYESKYGIVAEKTLDNGFILFSKAERTQHIQTASIDQINNPDDQYSYIFKYNIGKSKKKFILPQWTSSLDIIQDKFIQSSDPYYCIYDFSGNKLVETKAFDEPIIWNNTYIAKSVFYSADYSSNWGPFSVYQFFSFGDFKELWKDTFNNIRKEKDFIFLSNDHDPGKNKVFSTDMQDIFGNNYFPRYYLESVNHFVVEEKGANVMGVMDMNKETLVPLKYSWINTIETEELYQTNKYSHKYLIDARTEDSSFIYNSRYKLLFSAPSFRYELKDSLLEIQGGDFEALIDTTGKVIVPYKKWWLTLEKDYIQTGVWDGSIFDHGWYNYGGKEIFPPIYRKITPVKDGMVILERKEEDQPWKVDLADITGKIYTTAPYDSYRGFTDGVFMFSSHGSIFIYDEKGNYLFSIQANWISDFVNGEAQVQVGKKTGVINKKGEWVVKPRFKRLKAK